MARSSTAASTDPEISAATAALRAATGIGTDAEALETTGTLTVAALTEAGDINLNHTNALTVGTVGLTERHHDRRRGERQHGR